MGVYLKKGYKKRAWIGGGGMMLIGWVGIWAKQNIFLNIYTDSVPLGIYYHVGEEKEWKPGEYTLIVKGGEDWTRIAAQYQKQFKKKLKHSILKEVMAIPGDRVRVEGGGVWVNGKKLKGSERYKGIGVSKGVKRFKRVRVLGQGEVWLGSSDNPKSWDSRYWGVVNPEVKVRPIYIVNKKYNRNLIDK